MNTSRHHLHRRNLNKQNALWLKQVDDIICWWSGGVTSAVACRLAIQTYGLRRCRIIFQDTKNEDRDTYRFKRDCEAWYGKKIETITALGGKFKSIQDVWYHYLSLNVANGAICSSTLKRDLRLQWQRENTYTHQVFGFDTSEPKRAEGMARNHAGINPVFPLLDEGYSKIMCIELLQRVGIRVPAAYSMGYNNNNCLETGCVQGGVGYWQKMREDDYPKFLKMATVEHDLTDLKGQPVTMLKDQSNAAKQSGNVRVFLMPHPDYPACKDLSMMKGRPVKPLVDCNGFCGSALNNEPNETQQEIAFDEHPETGKDKEQLIQLLKELL